MTTKRPTGADNQLTSRARWSIWRLRLPGLLLVGAIAVISILVSRQVAVISPLILSIVLGVVARNTGMLKSKVIPGVAWSTKKLLRAGVVLLGLQLSLTEVLSLGLGELAAIGLTVVVTFLGTQWVGRLIGTSRGLTMLIATGFSICGASAVAAMSAVVGEKEASEDDVATSIAMVTLYGSVTLFTLPYLQGLVRLDDHQMGVWIGAAVHEVAQVVASASAVSVAALTVAVVVKLARVVLLAPLVAIVGVAERRRTLEHDRSSGARPPIVPLFVVGFLAMIAVRTTGLVPTPYLDAAQFITTVLLTAAMFALGTGVHVRTLRRTGGPAVALGAASTLLAMGVSLAGIHLLA